MKTIGRILICILLMATTGCTVMRPAKPYRLIGPSSGAHVATPVSQPVEANKVVHGPLTLEQCIEIALANNPDIRAGTWAVHAARAQRDEAAGQRWPSLLATGSATRHLDNQRLVPARGPREPGTFSDDIFGGDLVVKMPIFTGGLITSNIRAAELLQQAVEHRLVRTRKELVFNVSSVFYAILGQRRVVESLVFSRKVLEEHRKRGKDLMAVKKAARVDLLRVEVRLADLQQKLIREKNLLAIQHRVLGNLLGVESGSTPIEVEGDLRLSGVEENPDVNIGMAYAARADYQATLAGLAAQAVRVDIALAGHWPTAWLGGSYGGRWASGSSIKQSGADDSEDVGRVGITVDIPIFEGGRTDARVREERSRLAAAQEYLRKLELKIRFDVETAILSISANRERVRATEKAIEQAKESLRIERQKYVLGKGSITDVLDAQSALLDAQTSYYRVLADYNTSISELRLAVGERIGVEK